MKVTVAINVLLDVFQKRGEAADGKIPADQTIRLEAIGDRIQFHPSSPP